MDVQQDILFQTLFDHLPEPRVVIKADAPTYTIIACNRQYRNLSRTDNQTIIGKSISDLYPVNNASKRGDLLVRQALEKAVSTKTTVKLPAVRFDLPLADNSSITAQNWWQAEYIPVPDDEGKISHLICTIHDITEQVTNDNFFTGSTAHQEALEREQIINEELTAYNEELTMVNHELSQTQHQLQLLNEQLENRVLSRTQALSESENRFKTMAEGTDVLIAVSDITRNTIYCNHAWVELTGKPTESLLGFGWADAIHPDEREHHLDIFTTAFKERVPFSTEVRLATKNGKYCWLLVKGSPRFYGDDEFVGFVNSAIDITEQKNDEQRKNDFIGIVSHELKTPLTSMKGYLQMLLKTKNDGDDFTISTLNRANNQVKKMTTMINGFLNVSRLESGKILIEKTTFVLNELIQEVLAETNHTQASHQFTFLPCNDIVLHADRDKIGNVVSNLLSNATKYSAPGKHIEIGCTADNDAITVHIKDEGIGINPDDISKLFDRFYRSENKSTQTISGFGIGLYLCAEIIQRHGGTIGVESELGKGSTFWFTLPRFKNNNRE